MAKPEFDPNKPFDVAGSADTQTAKPAFDASQPHQIVGASTAPVASPGPSNALDETLGHTGADLAAGAAAGATQGFGSRLIGAGVSAADSVQALLNRLGLAEKSPTQMNEEAKEKLSQMGMGNVPVGPTDTSQLYNASKAATDQELAARRARSPWAYGGGELAGGIYTGNKLFGAAGDVLGDVAPSLAETKSAKELYQLGKTGDVAGVAQEGIKAVAADALKGAVPGAIAGAGYSSDDNMAQGALHGAETGGLIAGGIKLATLAPALGRAAVNNVTPLRRIFGAAEKGADLSTPSMLSDQGQAENLRQENAQTNANAAQITQAQAQAGQAIGDSIDAAKKAGAMVKPNSDLIARAGDLNAALEQNPGLASKSTINSIQNRLNQLATSGLNPEDAYQLRDDLKGMIKYNTPESVKDSAKAFFGNIDPNTGLPSQGSLYDAIHQVTPGFADSMSDYYNLNKIAESMFSKGQELPEYNLFGKATPKNIYGQMGKLTEGYGDNKPVTAGFNQMIGKLQANPELAAKFGLNPASLQSGVAGAADTAAINNNINNGIGKFDITQPLSSAVKGLQPVAYGVARAGSNVANGVSKLINAPGNVLQQVGNHLKISGFNELGDNLNKAINGNDGFLRNAAIFSILQNEGAKKALGLDNASNQ